MKIKNYMKNITCYLTTAAVVAALAGPAITPRSWAAESAPLSSAAPQRSAADLENLAAPMALYPDPLIAVMLPAAGYPVEVVQAARFVSNPGNLASLDDQPWDVNVKAVARFPSVIQKMNDDLSWTIDLGQAFVEQPLELMDAIQTLRARAHSAGTLQTTPQQVVTVGQAVVERTDESQIVYVTNTVVQVMPANPEIIYVPEYNPAVIYAPPPTYLYDPGVQFIAFGPGIAVGGLVANYNVDWYYGGVYYGPGRAPVWVGFGHGPFFPPPPYHRPPPHRPPPSHSPRPPGKPPYVPGKPPQAPGKPPRPPGNPPAQPGKPPRPPGNPPQSPGNPPQPPPKPPQPPGTPPQAPSKPPQLPGDPPQAPSKPPRPPGNPPQPASRPPQAPGNQPQAPSNPPQPPGRPPQPPSNPSQPPGRPPQPPSRTPQAPGNAPRTPGRQPARPSQTSGTGLPPIVTTSSARWA
jgi:hypothetical protein